MKHAVDDHGSVFHFEINAPVFGSEAIELFVVALNYTKLIAVKVFEVVFFDMELIEQIKLLHGPHLRHFCRTDFIKNDFQHEDRVGRILRLGKSAVWKLSTTLFVVVYGLPIARNLALTDSARSRA